MLTAELFFLTQQAIFVSGQYAWNVSPYFL